MNRALLAAIPLLLASLAPGAAATTCDQTGQVCWGEGATGACGTQGTGWTDVTARNVMLGFPLVAQWHTAYSCAGASRMDTWNVNATAGDRAAVRVTWLSQPALDWTWMRIDVQGPMTNSSTYWEDAKGDCTLFTVGFVGGAFVSDRRDCPAGPPAIPLFPWNSLLP